MKKYRALNNKESNIRQAAVRALEKLGDVTAIKPLTSLLNDNEYYIRDAVKRALAVLEANKEKTKKQGSVSSSID